MATLTEISCKPTWATSENLKAPGRLIEGPYEIQDVDGVHALQYAMFETYYIDDNGQRIDYVGERLVLDGLLYVDSLFSGLFTESEEKQPYARATIFELRRNHFPDPENPGHEIIEESIRLTPISPKGGLALTSVRYNSDGKLEHFTENSVLGSLESQSRDAGCYELAELPENIDFLTTVAWFLNQIEHPETAFRQPIFVPAE